MLPHLDFVMVSNRESAYYAELVEFESDLYGVMPSELVNRASVPEPVRRDARDPALGADGITVCYSEPVLETAADQERVAALARACACQSCSED